MKLHNYIITMARRWATFQAVGCLVQSYFPYRLVKRQCYYFVHLQLHPQQANGISQNEKFAKAIDTEAAPQCATRGNKVT